ncbi:MAG: hypothetical protein Q8R83_06080 [Legionellaceae bacterium]|nr:hypothetical protein [Legionellaceae bacterium]
MTNEEALKAQFSSLNKVKPMSIQFHLMEQSLNASDEYTLGNRKALDLALAGLLFVLATNPKSISELDFSITSHDPKELLQMREGLLNKWNVKDTMSTGPTITGKSPW